MSTMTLQLPVNFVDIERDEMEYVDGGIGFTWNQLNSTIQALGFANRSTYGGL